MTGPPASLAAARSAVREALDDLAPGATVLVACSGGADSLALAVALRDVAAQRAWRAGAVVVDHGLQPASDQVADRAAEACRGLGLDPVVVRRVQVSGSGGPEAAARQARYAALAEVARGSGAVAVLLGHTLDDQAEGVLLALARGSGTRSLAGMRPREGAGPDDPVAPGLPAGVWRRPFLGLRRATTEDVCAHAGLEPWHDPTNAGADGDPVRSRLRSRVLPLLGEVLGPGVPEALARTAAMAREDDDHLASLAAAAVREAVRAAAPADGWDVETLAAQPVAVRRRAVHQVLVAGGVAAGALTRVHVLAVDALLTRWHGQGPVDLPGRRRASRRCGTLVVERPAGR